ncbi:hypothetical protein [uncultured Massilia sp.]|uniref:hypothetical protein n=1 Tax=uncultured Massilia sp. TaxID=169973 RepID=UPI002589A98C|nr:hypothetical protein [uncultured Massilia sp.]
MHQKILDWGVALLASAVGLLALIGVLLFAWHVENATPWKSMEAGDWGVWVGSIGTVGTLVGALRIATNADRKAERERLDLAIIAAASVAMWIASFRGAIWMANNSLPDGLEMPEKAKLALINCASIVEEVGVSRMDDLHLLVPLPNHVAARLAQISMEISSTIATLKQEIRKADFGRLDTMRSHAHFIDMLRLSNDDLFAIQDECLSFLARHDYRPDK